MPKTIDVIAVVLFVCFVVSGVTADDSTSKAKPEASPGAKEQEKKKDWKPLFNGKDLKDWKVTNFGGEGKVNIGPKGGSRHPRRCGPVRYHHDAQRSPHNELRS